MIVLIGISQLAYSGDNLNIPLQIVLSKIIPTFNETEIHNIAAGKWSCDKTISVNKDTLRIFKSQATGDLEIQKNPAIYRVKPKILTCFEHVLWLVDLTYPPGEIRPY